MSRSHLGREFLTLQNRKELHARLSYVLNYSIIHHCNTLNMVCYLLAIVIMFSLYCSANRESCAMSTTRLKGYHAFAYDPETQQCQRAPATCLRPAQDETPKKVYMSSVTSGLIDLLCGNPLSFKIFRMYLFHSGIPWLLY